MTTRCPYCDIEVSESSIEAEDGCCPECGSVISTPSSFMGDDDDSDLDEELDAYGDLDDDDDFLNEDALDEQLFDDEEFDEDFEDFEEEDDKY